MKYAAIIFSFLLIIFMSCDEAKKILNIREAPVIEEVILVPDDGLVYPQDTVYAEVVATNPEEGTLTYYWSTEPENAGQFIEARDKKSTRWVAPFSGEEYKIKIEVSNGYKSVDSHRKVKVVEVGDPLVEISSPAGGSHLVQNAPIEISGNVFHGNGIEKVVFLVNGNVFKERLNIDNGPYSFFFTPDSTYIGLTALKVEATAKIVSTVGSAQVDITIEGFLPKRPADD